METLLTDASPRVPLPPESLEEAGLPEELVAGLLVKALHGRGSAGGFDLAAMLALPYSLLDDVLEQLQAQRLVQVHATKGPTRGEYVYALTSEGRRRAAEELELSRYVGPAPVPFDDFIRWVELQTIEAKRISPPELQRALEGIVLPEAILEVLGPAINSGRSAFLYGDSGNGKTLLAKRLARAYGDRYYVPYSVLVDGGVMIVYDPIYHGSGNDDRRAERRARMQAEPATPVEDSFSLDGGAAEGDAWSRNEGGTLQEHGSRSVDVLQEILRTVSGHDRRFAEARRPAVVTGGELTLEQLDLQWDSAGGMYHAPPQLKAAGGVLIIDDLGRQRVQVRELLNRWGVPLEQRQDHLTLKNGRKLVVPFDCFVVFSTNLEPRELGDDAFMRRIHYKIEITDPGRGDYERIFRSCCEERDIVFDERALDYIFGEFYGKRGLAPRRCHPRDVLDHVCHLAEYRGEQPRLDPDLLEPACRSYFLAST